MYSLRIAAWGASDFVSAGEAAGFDADEGFDTFLAMDAPPERVRILKLLTAIGRLLTISTPPLFSE